MSSSFGFILTRCVKAPQHEVAWRECYDSIRRLYDCLIIIIDDNSKQNLIKDKELVNTIIINSEFPGAGEFLPYYYFYKLKPFDKAIILHDSMFVQKEINIDNIDVKFLWYFDTHRHDNAKFEKSLFEKLNHSKELIDFYNQKTKWYGCFGVASIISYDYVQLLNDKYNFFILKNFIRNRLMRCALERVFATIAFYEGQVELSNCSLMGNILKYSPNFSFRWDHYVRTKIHRDKKIMKIWFGR